MYDNDMNQKKREHVDIQTDEVSDFLRGCREYEQKHGGAIPPFARPAFHLSPYIGWMNDPNGFSYYNNQFHLFYQYNPYGTVWDSMHWGHAVSDDLLSWKHLPAALAPDQEYDASGCFSGSAETLDDGRQILMYTSVGKIKDAEGNLVERQTQSIAFGDGLNYQKYENNPVLNASDLPEGGSPVDFRDPKIFRDTDGHYKAVIANRAADGSGQILLFSSPDALDWKFESVLLKNNRRHGLMWECPDLFCLDGKDVLIMSPQDMYPSGLEYASGNGTMAVIGKIDPEDQTFHEQNNHSIDYGIDFYAPQTLLTPDGRRIMTAWMQNWDTVGHRKNTMGWFSQMTVPRELSIQNGRLIQNPVREIEQYRHDPVEYKGVLLDHEKIVLDGIQGRIADIELVIRPDQSEDSYRKFKMYFAQDHRFYTEIVFDRENQTVMVNRQNSGTRRSYVHQRTMKVHAQDGVLKLRILLDRFSAEVFVNDGQQAMSTVIYTDQDKEGISFECDGRCLVDVVKYDLS
ncbi:glycoside hydrolase family 32 protein [Ileibacterium valens]|uniref:glycoside hydrolase family 32 protein n=1 Tax=Ileibacterium valens TaxID=1862668 RepID=UPI0024BBDF5D|nr:glycoside hydrolase family 32 protein [Ileibacterium valens]